MILKIPRIINVFHLFLFLILIFDCNCLSASSSHCSKKIIICGLCKDIEPFVLNTITNIENLGARFDDFKVIIYENNSSDNTAPILSCWASNNLKITFIMETLPDHLLQISRTEKIAHGRNILLEEIRKIEDPGFEYVIMVDLDHPSEWPIDEIIATIESPAEWDCVSANGIRWGILNLPHPIYYDRYAHRDLNFPLGPEILGDLWWTEFLKTLFAFEENEQWIPVYSAFGGLAIYKKEAIIDSSYSGIVNEDLEKFYEEIFILIPDTNHYRQLYLQMNGVASDSATIPINFQFNTASHASHNYPYITCCEHIPFHAGMRKNGFNKIFINPKMILRG